MDDQTKTTKHRSKRSILRTSLRNEFGEVWKNHKSFSGCAYFYVDNCELDKFNLAIQAMTRTELEFFVKNLIINNLDLEHELNCYKYQSRKENLNGSELE